MALKKLALPHGIRAISHTLGHAFPMPAYLMMPAAGIDISDSSIKWLVLKMKHTHVEIASFGEIKLEKGIVMNGSVRDVTALAAALTEVKKQLGGIRAAHAGLPEEAAYVFEMHIAEGISRHEAMSLIEFEFEGRIPIPPNAAVYDFDIIQKHDDGVGEDIGVSVFPRELAESYAAAFETAGIRLLSLELEARSIARAVTKEGDETVTLLVDFGRARTGFAVLKRGIPIFTSTVEVGGDAITNSLMGTMSLSEVDAIKFRNEQGLTASGEKLKGLDAIIPVASALSDEIARHFHYWDTRRNEHGERMTPVSKVVLVGGSTNLQGLGEYIAGRVQAPAIPGDVWVRTDFGDTVPQIDKRTSLQYATAVGLALRTYL